MVTAELSTVSPDLNMDCSTELNDVMPRSCDMIVQLDCSTADDSEVGAADDCALTETTTDILNEVRNPC